MSVSPFLAAVNQIVDEKGISKEQVIETIEAAIAAAYRRDYGEPTWNIQVKFNVKNATFGVTRVFEVVASEEEVEDPERQLTLAEAVKRSKKIKVGEEIVEELEPKEEFGRIAAQTAKQVIIQRLREAERDVLFEEFKKHEHELLNGTVQQTEGKNVIINLGKINGVLTPREQVPGEDYHVGKRVKVFAKEVADTGRGLQIIVSRADAQLISELFKKEVPEIAEGSVEIKAISREAGSRTKIAIYTEVEGLDPVGSCVGQRGTRVQAILAEVGDEKIDITVWDADPDQFIINALSPAVIERVERDDAKRHAIVYVNEDQLSLAIGRGGQNVRLASKITGYTIDVERADGVARNVDTRTKPTESEAESATENENKADTETKTEPEAVKKAKTTKKSKTKQKSTKSEAK